MTSTNHYAIADTGCTGHFLHIDNPCTARIPINNRIFVQLPNKTKIQATHTCQIDIPFLPPQARQAHIFPQLTRALPSIGQLCDHGCTAIFDHNNVKILHNNIVLLHGFRDSGTNLWKIPLTQDHTLQTVPISTAAPTQANSAYHTSTQPKLVQFMHAVCGYHVPSTWIQAIQNGNFAIWPGLTADAVHKHLPKSTATVKGDLNQQQKNVRSTQLQVSEPNPTKKNKSPIIDSDLNIKTHQIFAATIEVTGQISTDLTGRFPVTSSRGNKYLLVLYNYDSNSILTAAMKN